MFDPLHVWIAATVVGLIFIGVIARRERRAIRENKKNNSELVAKAEEGLLKLGLTDYELGREQAKIDEVARGGYSPYSRMILPNLAEHTSRHTPSDIIETCIEVAMHRHTSPTVLTDDYFVIYKRLEKAFTEDDKFYSSVSLEAADKYSEVLQYAMKNIEDGYLILSIIYDRGINNLEEILELLPTLKENETNALAEGSL